MKFAGYRLMKRSESLQSFSREHHDALMFCLLLKKGVNRKVALSTLRDFIYQFWHHDLEPHFQSEEKVLVPLLERFQFPVNIIRSIKLDHDIIRTIQHRINMGAVSHKTIENFSMLIEQHIRFEERVAFEQIQRLIPEKELFDLHLAENTESVCKTYPVKFWE